MNKEIIDFAFKNNLFLSSDALKHLCTHDYKEKLLNLKERGISFVNEKDLIPFKSCEKKHHKNFYTLHKYDVTGKNLSQGKIEDFHKLFLDKYQKLSKIIKERPDFEPINIETAKTLIKGKPAHIIGMVYEKKISKNGNLVLTVDDPTGEIMLVILKGQEQDFLEHKNILLDNVLGFKTSVLSKNMLIVNEVIYPDLPFTTKNKTLEREAYIAIIGDVHVGSKKFREKEFVKFIEWVNGNLESDKDIAKKIEYIIIAGDLVDGVGIYPTQYNELAITDIKKQYELFEEYILKIREDIDIFLISGNHDAVRLSDPQPAISEDFLPNAYKKQNIHILGSPSWVVIENFKTLLYHGASLHGIYSKIKETSMNKPDLAMKELLKRRDLMPEYGGRQTFIPIEQNFMVINDEPDIFICADGHHHAYSKYNQTHLISASCWQDVTDYQKEKGHIPTISKVILFNLKNQEIKIKDFFEK